MATLLVIRWWWWKWVCLLVQTIVVWVGGIGVAGVWSRSARGVGSEVVTIVEVKAGGGGGASFSTSDAFT